MGLSVDHYVIVGINFGSLEYFQQNIVDKEKYEELIFEIEDYGLEIAEDEEYVIIGYAVAKGEGVEGIPLTQLSLEDLRHKHNSIQNKIEKDIGIEPDENSELGIWAVTNIL